VNRTWGIAQKPSEPLGLFVMRKQPVGRRVLRSSEVAEMFAVSEYTIGRWADAGLIPSFRTPGGQRRFYADDIANAIAALTGPKAS